MERRLGLQPSLSALFTGHAVRLFLCLGYSCVLCPVLCLCVSAHGDLVLGWQGPVSSCLRSLQLVGGRGAGAW